MGARRPGATSTRRSWSTTSASTTSSTRVASMVMGTGISRLRVRASARMKARTQLSEYEEKGFDDDEEVEDVEPELDPAEYEDDETYTRVLQESEREVSARLMGPRWDSAIGGQWSMSRIT